MTQFLKDWMSSISSDLYEEILKPKSLNQKQFLKDFLLNIVVLTISKWNATLLKI